MLHHALVCSTIAYCVATCMHDALVRQGRRKRYGRYGFGCTTFLEEPMRGRKFDRRGIRYASYPGFSQKAGEGLVRTVCACALISRHSGNSVTRTDTSVSFDVTTVYYPVLVLDFSLARRGLCPPVSSLPVLRSSRCLHFSQTCGGKPPLALKLTRC